jgi:predicted nucleic acid-binding protein
MSERLIVDASVIIKAFVDEIDSDAADALWSSDVLLAAPAHALAEVGEALRRKLKQGEVTAEQWEEIAVALPGVLVSMPLDPLLEPSMRIATELQLGFYDSLYLAAAGTWDCGLVTADEKLANAAANTAWEPYVILLREYQAAGTR